MLQNLQGSRACRIDACKVQGSYSLACKCSLGNSYEPCKIHSFSSLVPLQPKACKPCSLNRNQRTLESIQLAKIVALHLARSFESLQALQHQKSHRRGGGLNLPWKFWGRIIQEKRRHSNSNGNSQEPCTTLKRRVG